MANNYMYYNMPYLHCYWDHQSFLIRSSFLPGGIKAAKLVYYHAALLTNGHVHLCIQWRLAENVTICMYTKSVVV